ncbi:hypothetical protein IJ541_02200 [bacterium]|nr:hypothetical protein [bacterium]
MSQQSVNGLNIPAIQPKRQIVFQQNPVPAMQGQGVSMSGIDQEKVRQSVDNNYLANRAKASKETNPLTLFGIGAGLWYAIGQLMEKLNPKFGGKYEDSLGGKIGGLGDKFSNTFVGKKIDGVISWFGRQVDKLAGKSKIVYSLRHHSTQPQNQFAKIPGKGLLGFLSADAETVIEEFMKPIGHKFQRLEQYGVPQARIDALVRSLKGKSKYVQTIAIQKTELAQLGADSKIVEKILKKRGIAGLNKYAQYLKAQHLGFKNLKEFHKLKGKFIDNPEEALKMFDTIAEKHPNWKVSIWRGMGTANSNPIAKAWFRIKSHLFGRNVSFSEYRNKYLIALGKGDKSRLGRAMSKAFGWLVEGGTNRFGGGKLAVAMQAFIFADMFINTFKAPKGEKIKTLAERAVNDFSYFVAMTLGIIGMHKVGGFKYAGLDNAGREAYRKALIKFNKKADAGLFKDKKAYDQAFKALKAKLGTKNIKNPITKLLQKLGSFINIGNERVHSYVSKSKYNMNWLRKLANGNILGVPMRILIPLAIVTPIFVKFTTSLAHKIFGRPTHSVLDEDEEEKTEDSSSKQNPSQVKQPEIVSTQPNIPQVKPKSPQDYQSDTNLIKMAANGQKPPQPVSNSAKNPFQNGVNTTTTTTTATVNSDKVDTEQEPLRTYIPSPEGVVQQGPDLSPAEKALADADTAEKFINETLASMK